MFSVHVEVYKLCGAVVIEKQMAIHHFGVPQHMELELSPFTERSVAVCAWVVAFKQAYLVDMVNLYTFDELLHIINGLEREEINWL